MARIERVPAIAEINLEPGGEIHRRLVRRHADVAEIAGAIARRDVHAAAERNGEMGKVAADAAALLVRLPGAFGRARVRVAELDVAVDVIANRLHQRPALGRGAEFGPRQLDEAIGFAVPAAE